MPQCIFCEEQTEHDVARGRSICLECLASLKRFEKDNAAVLTRMVLPPELVAAMGRMQGFDPETATDEENAQFKADADLVRQMRLI